MDKESNSSDEQDNYQPSKFQEMHGTALQQHLMTFSSFLIFGERGVGKNTFIHRLLSRFRVREKQLKGENCEKTRQTSHFKAAQQPISEGESIGLATPITPTTQVPYITINCLRAERKPAFLSVLQRRLEWIAELEEPFSKITSLESLLMQVNYRFARKQREQFQQIAKAGGLYCLLQSLESSKMSQRFLTMLIEIGRHHLPFRIAFVLQATQIPTMLMSQQLEIFSMSKFHFCNPDASQLKAILKKQMEKHKDEFTRSYTNYGQFSEQLCKVMTESLRIVVCHIDHAKDYLNLAYRKLMDLNTLERENRQEQQKSRQPVPFDTHKLLISPAFREYTAMNLEYGPAPESEFQKQRDITNALMGNLDIRNWENAEHSEFYVELLKTALDMAARCEEKDDVKRFMDCKHNGKSGSRSKGYTETEVKNKKINLFRVLAIADSLESQIIRDNPVRQEEAKEFHSLDYKLCLQYLALSEKLKIGGGSGAFGMGRVSSRVTKYENLAFLKRNNLNSRQFFEA